MLRRVIRLEAVTKVFEAARRNGEAEARNVHALRGVTMTVAEGEFVALVGPSGCGKTTLLHLAGGLDQPTSGEIWLEDQPLHRLDERALALLRRRKVGIVFQFFNLLPHLTALENIALPLRLARTPASRGYARAKALLEEVGLSDKGARHPAELSGGEQQRVALARALVHEPALLLADEPTGNLDSESSGVVLEALRRLQRSRGAALLLVTHSARIAAAADRVLRMRDGLLIEANAAVPLRDE
ncbi:MAG: ABC transporter ATP-binding protein [Verrucomicrobiae bacterium]|nr:ABC transporter ATP-binding protein [Verrucomicrobiae bacterium]